MTDSELMRLQLPGTCQISERFGKATTIFWLKVGTLGERNRRSSNHLFCYPGVIVPLISSHEGTPIIIVEQAGCLFFTGFLGDV